MKIGRMLVMLEDAAGGYNPVVGGVEYTDVGGARVFVPMTLLVRLYEGVKWHHERSCVTPWDEYCQSLFKESE